MNLSSTKIKLSKVCSVKTVQAYTALSKKDESLASNDILYIPQEIYRKGDYAFVTSLDSINDRKGYIITSNTEDLLYLAFLINSLLSRSILFDGQINQVNKVKISKQKLQDLTIWKLDQETSDIYSNFEVLVAYSYICCVHKNVENESMQVAQELNNYMVYSDIRNALSIELALHPLFEKAGVYVCKYCQEIIQSIDSEDENPHMTFIKKYQGADNPLRNNMKKMVMVIEDMDKHIREAQNNNGLED